MPESATGSGVTCEGQRNQERMKVDHEGRTHRTLLRTATLQDAIEGGEWRKGTWVESTLGAVSYETPESRGS
jgi:hypothetical protein